MYFWVGLLVYKINSPRFIFRYGTKCILNTLNFYSTIILMRDIIMNEKILTVKNHIQKAMPDRNIDYQNAGGLYKFKI